MMSYSKEAGTFPLTKKECGIIVLALEEKIRTIETKGLANNNPHEYIQTKQTIAKIDGYIKLMKIRAIEEMKNDRL